MADVTIIANGTGSFNIGINDTGKPVSFTCYPTADVVKGPVSGTLSIPTLFSLSGTIGEINYSVLDAQIPGVILSVAEGGAYFKESIPAIQAKSLSASTNSLASALLKLPYIKLIASGSSDLIVSLSKQIPGIKISASAHSDALASLSKSIPAIKISSSAISGYIASLSKPIPAIDLTATSYFSSGATLSQKIPAIKMSGRVVGTITFLSMNAKTAALSTYSNYDFRDLCIFNGVAIGSKEDGIYDLSGEKDGNDTIVWKVNTGLLDFKNANLRYIIVNGKLPSDLIAIVALPDGTEYEYRIEAISDYEDELRIKVGKGLNDRYISIELTNEDSADVNIDSITLFGLKSSVKR